MARMFKLRLRWMDRRSNESSKLGAKCFYNLLLVNNHRFIKGKIH